MNTPLSGLQAALAAAGIEARFDRTSRLLYSTDASIYQQEPVGVVFPRHAADLEIILDRALRCETPVIARGAGSGLAGQAIGPGLVVDCSRYLRQAIIDPERRVAVVEPGITLNALNRQAAAHGLQFGPDPASAERATIGGSLANNAAGAHSILHGMAVDHLLAADVILSDGSPARLEARPLAEAQRLSAGQGVEAAFYRAALRIRQRDAAEIQARWPRTWRCASGYPLNYLLPWAAAQPPQWPGAYPPVAGAAGPDTINLAALLAGSEGTLALIQRAELRLVPLPKAARLAVLTFDSLGAACDATLAVLELDPSAVELIPHTVVAQARALPAYAAQLATLSRLDPRAELLVVEFAGDEPAALQAKLERLRALRLGNLDLSSGELFVAETPAVQKQVWAVRKVGLGLMLSRPGDTKPWSFIEDLSVPVAQLGHFIAGMEALLRELGTTGEIYGHASAGCLHIRPLLELKTAGGVQRLRQAAEAAVDLTLSLGGAVSGEHGLGQARSEWLQRQLGPRLLESFRELKHAADPFNLLNPGKIVSPDAAARLPRMDENLRFGPAYQAAAWAPVLDFSAGSYPDSQNGLAGAIEQCNGAGVCRKAEGVMCPSFQALQEEEHSTRGRANLLRALISGRFPDPAEGQQTVYDALALCLACKGCQAECPSGVDVGRLKVEFLAQYYRAHRRPLRDYLFAYIGPLARLGKPLGPLANLALGGPPGRGFARLLGLASQRSLPRFPSPPAPPPKGEGSRPSPPGRGVGGEGVLYLPDAFTAYFEPQLEQAALAVLAAAGLQVLRLPVTGAGRTLISKGFLQPARRHVQKLLEAVRRLDPQGRLPVVSIEPSEVAVLYDELPALLPGDTFAAALGRRAWGLEEFLLRPSATGEAYLQRLTRAAGSNGAEVLFHGHCHSKARPPAPDGLPVGPAAVLQVLQALGYRPALVDAGCCGMAGAFGYESEHYAVSQQVGELALFPAVRQAPAQTLVAAAGASCREQIRHGAGRAAGHPVELIAAALQPRPLPTVEGGPHV